MGNTNSSGKQGEQKQEVVVNTESVQGERNIIPEDESKGYHEKTDESPSTNDDPAISYEGDKEELNDKETETQHTYELPEVQIEENDSVSPDIDVQIDRLNEEKHQLMCVGNQVENAFGGSGEAGKTMEMNSHIRDVASQYSEDAPQVNKSMDLTQEVPNRSENAGKKRDHKRTEPSKQAFHESHIDNAAHSTIMKEDYAMKVANVANAADNVSIQTDVCPAKHQHPVEQPIYAEEVFGILAEKGTGPTKFTSAVNNHEQIENGIVARIGGRVEKSCYTELIDKCILQLGTFTSGNDVFVNSSSFSLNSQYSEGMMQGYHTAEEWNVGITRLKEHIGSELLVIEDSDVQTLRENKSLENPKLEAEDEQKVQTSIQVLAFTNKKYVNGEMLPLFRHTAPSKAPEITVQRFSIESKSGDETDLRKSPSFDFGVSYDAKSEESDQTPLVYPEKTLTRSLSLGSQTKFSNLFEYEAVAVEEKSVWMEKNDYQVSKAPSLGLLKTGEIGESSSEIDSKTSPKGSGKRQPNHPSSIVASVGQHQYNSLS